MHTDALVSRFEADLLTILQGFLGHVPRSHVLPLLLRPGRQRPPCLSRAAVELVQDTLAKGATLLVAEDGWRQERLAAHAEEAGRLGKDLYERMAILAEHVNDVGQSLGKSVIAYNKAVGSLETRILPAARRRSYAPAFGRV